MSDGTNPLHFPLSAEELSLLRRKEWELRVYCPPDGNPGPFHAIIAKILEAYS